MHPGTLRGLCLAMPGATEGQPFGPDSRVFQVGGKLFALTNLERMPPAVNLKCDPERAVELREACRAVEPGWHMTPQERPSQQAPLGHGRVAGRRLRA